ncbi:MAG TPA: amidohydrolase family protein [Longimicrobium sp.]|nr:amidohydrolase family protein [Longimicrobium sp.]
MPQSRSDRKPARIAAMLAALGALLVAAPLHAQATYDIIIRNGRVLDGTGNPWYRADVAVRGDRIVAVGDLAGARAAREIDAAGLYVAPGFIDVHTHAGDGLATAALAPGRPLLAQGITTVLVNPDGGGATDMARQRAAILSHGVGVNVAQLVPHGSIRQAVMGMADRAPTPAEMERMRALVRTGMEEGAFGISTGPWYAPGSYAKTEELIDLSRIAASFGGAYSSHIRDEGDFNVGLMAAVDEVIRIGREAKLPVVVTHIKALGPRVWGYSAALVQRIDRARAEGVEVFADQYPYTASATSLTGALVPRWAQAGGDTALIRRIGDRAEGPRLRAELLENLERRGGAERIQFRRFRADTAIEGKTLQWVAMRDRVAPVDAVLALLRGGGASVVSFNMHDEDVDRLMRQPWMMTASDGDLVPMGEGVPHPRSYGTYPRKIREYVVRRGVVDLGAAIRSMTSLPATVFRIPDRGILRAGAIADVVVFDLARVNDPATFADPHRLGEGMVHVLVNGQPALSGGSFAATLHGRVLARTARR